MLMNRIRVIRRVLAGGDFSKVSNDEGGVENAGSFGIDPVLDERGTLFME